MGCGPCMSYTDQYINDIAQEQVRFWRVTSYRPQPTTTELAIMLANVPAKVRTKLANAIIIAVHQN